jgi:hypothetical protein
MIVVETNEERNMILKFTNSQKPVAAKVFQSIFDDESVIVPLTPEKQSEWSKAAKPNRRYKTLNPALN